MTQWFRFYGDAINDPKILKLPEATRWRWVAVLAAASKCQGAIPPADDLALMLRINMQQTLELIKRLWRAKLIDTTETGGNKRATFQPTGYRNTETKHETLLKRFTMFQVTLQQPLL